MAINDWSDEEWIEIISRTISFEAEIDDEVGFSEGDPREFALASKAVGELRALRLRRAFAWGVDAPTLLMILCKWPFKPVVEPGVREVLTELRLPVIEGFRRTGEVESILEFIPAEVIVLGHDDLNTLISTGDIINRLNLPMSG